MERAQKEALLADLTAHHHILLAALLGCYASETDEVLKIRLYALIGSELPRAQRIVLADQAARNGQSRLLQRIIESLKSLD